MNTSFQMQRRIQELDLEGAYFFFFLLFVHAEVSKAICRAHNRQAIVARAVEDQLFGSDLSEISAQCEDDLGRGGLLQIVLIVFFFDSFRCRLNSVRLWLFLFFFLFFSFIRTTTTLILYSFSYVILYLLFYYYYYFYYFAYVQHMYITMCAIRIISCDVGVFFYVKLFLHVQICLHYLIICSLLQIKLSMVLIHCLRYSFLLFILQNQMFVMFSILFIVHYCLFIVFNFLFVEIIICSCC